MQAAWQPGAHSCTATPRTPPNGRSATPRLSPSQSAGASPISVRLPSGEEAAFVCKRPPSVPSPSCAASTAVGAAGNYLGEVRELLARETRERADGQQALTLKLQQQQASIAQLAMQVDEALAELRASAFARRDADGVGRTIYSPGAGGSRQHLGEELVEPAQESEDVQSLRDLLASEIESAHAAIAEVRESLTGLEHRVAVASPQISAGSARGEWAGADDADPDASGQAADSDQEASDEAVLDRLIEARLESLRTDSARQAADLEAHISDVEAKLKDEWMALRGWVDAAVVAVINRISSLECQMQVSGRRADAAYEDALDDRDDEGHGAEAGGLLHEECSSAQPSWQPRQPAREEVAPSHGRCRSHSPVTSMRTRSLEAYETNSEGVWVTLQQTRVDPLTNGDVIPVGRALYTEVVHEMTGDRSGSAVATPSTVTPLPGTAASTSVVAAVAAPAVTPMATSGTSSYTPWAHSTVVAAAASGSGGSGTYPPRPQSTTAVAAAASGSGGSGSYPPRPQSTTVSLPPRCGTPSYEAPPLTTTVTKTHTGTSYVQVVAASRAWPGEAIRTAAPTGTTTAYTAAVVRSSSAGGMPGLSPQRASLAPCPGTPSFISQARHIGGSC